MSFFDQTSGYLEKIPPQCSFDLRPDPKTTIVKYMHIDAWKPKLYSLFTHIRRPAFDELLKLIEQQQDMEILDVGCGSGEFTLELHQRLKAKSTQGVEFSDQMLEEAYLIKNKGLHFDRGDINCLDTSRKFDLVFSNGVLHYARNPVHVLGTFKSLLKPGGQIAIQGPRNPNSFPIELGYELAKKDKYLPFCRDLISNPKVMLGAEALSEIVFNLGFQSQVARTQAHSHPLQSGEELLSWLRSTFLLEFESRMPESVFSDFYKEYQTAFDAKIPLDRPYHYILQRVYVWAKA